ncbi:MAG: hypothetical protein GQ570_12345 [Helicobacteraceae bacterium]|nr:hypothetical protein [Helicobacteraceae bacterium]
MIKLFFDTTDEFLYKRVRDTFEKVERGYKRRHLEVDLEVEYENFEFDPLIVTTGSKSNFEKDLKYKLKIILGIYFVAVPFMGAIFVASLLGFSFSYAAVFTFVVAVLSASRMEEIARRYVEFRKR